MKPKFNPDGKNVLTYAEALGPAMQVTDEADAQQYFAEYVAFIQRGLDREARSSDTPAVEIARRNLGYYAGYYDHDTRLRVERLFLCAHPVFGNAAEHAPTSTEAFAAGEAAAQK